LLYLVGETSQVQALTAPASIILLSLLMFMLSVVWRELIRARQLALGTPMFLIRAVHSDCNLREATRG
jgi:hypothetical protein